MHSRQENRYDMIIKKALEIVEIDYEFKMYVHAGRDKLQNFKMTTYFSQ